MNVYLPGQDVYWVIKLNQISIFIDGIHGARVNRTPLIGPYMLETSSYYAYDPTPPRRPCKVLSTYTEIAFVAPCCLPSYHRGFDLC